MQDIDIDKLLGVMGDDKVADNAMSLTDMLATANKVLGQVTSLMDKFDKMGLKPLLVRGAGAKLNIDAETPLMTDNAVTPATPAHKQLFENLNTMTEAQLMELFNNDQTDDQSTTDND